MNLFALLLALFFASLSTYMVYCGMHLCFQYARLRRENLVAQGTVTGIKIHQRQRKGRQWLERSAIIAFETSWYQKREVIYAPPLGNTSFKIGDQMPVWYDHDDPRVFSLGWRYFIREMVLVCVFAVFFGFPGWSITYLMLLKPYFNI